MYKELVRFYKTAQATNTATLWGYHVPFADSKARGAGSFAKVQQVVAEYAESAVRVLLPVVKKGKKKRIMLEGARVSKRNHAALVRSARDHVHVV